ncbi:unnamed protein product, partial [Rotaria sordida]
LWHEQSRPDRDSYVRIYAENIQVGMEGNFQKMDNTQIDTQNPLYDYESLMHYERNEFSKNGLPTIEPIQPNVKIGQRLYLTPTDIREIQLYYNCTGSGPTLPPTTTVITTTTTYPVIPLSKCAKVTASNYTTTGYGSPMYQGNYLVDRQPTGLGFNSGGFAPQYIQLELPQDSRVRDICLQVNQYPSA